MDRLMQEMYDELEDIQRDPYINREDRERGEKKVIGVIISYKQNELMQVMNSVAGKYMKWSLAKDKFISEVVSYSNDITSKVNTGEITQDQAMRSLDQEIANLRKQDEAMTRKNVQQVILVKASIDDKRKNINDRVEGNIKLTIAGIGFVTSGLQVVVGVGMVGSVVGTMSGALLIAHGVNGVVENGYYLLYRKDYTGPVKFVYEGIGEQLGLSKRDSDVAYTVVDIALSVNGMLGYKLAEDAARLYRYINADLLWGLKEMGINSMSSMDIIVEVLGDINTIYSQKRSY
ncbi:DUF4225 domain-containing protein [Serratia fonticola]|uniref:DUF4225 domain-containing protein n=1 Tax=Serratia fonticola TaxID=47917 RepID=UPI00093BE2E1|nr:DUF4225 domain-containing protein [Serratia fonticola]OKP26695.1 hypothetical protein BSQ40_17735 [Serratia fonticola]